MKKKIFVLGAGISGLSVSYKLAQKGYQVSVYEKENKLGGMSTTFISEDICLDLGPHKIFSNLKHMMDETLALFSENELLKIPKKSRIRLGKTYLNYPVGIKDIFFGLGLYTGMLCGFSYLFSQLRFSLCKVKDDTYEDWLVNRFGRKIYELVFAPYAKKIWGEPSSLSRELAETRVAIPNLLELIKQFLLNKKTEKIISAEYFYYPEKGIIELSNKMAEIITINKGNINLQKSIRQIKVLEDRVVEVMFEDGENVILGEDDLLVSTIPIHNLIRALTPDLPSVALEAVANLKTRKLILVYVVVKKERITDDNWLFFPGGEYVFNRVSEQKGFSKNMVPEDKTVLCCEVTTDENDYRWINGFEDKDYSNVIDLLVKADLIERSDVLRCFSVKLDNAYPVYDIWYKERLEIIYKSLDNIKNLFLVGRVGAYKYTGMLDCMEIGNQTAEFIDSAADYSQWKCFRERFEHFIVID